MKLNIKPLSQKDRRWGSKKLPGGGTLARYGCLLTCLAMQFGTTPDKLLTKDIFSGNYINWGKAAKALDFQFQWISSGDFKQICRERADRGLPTIIRIANFEHFVLCIGYDDTSKELFINDPLYGETYYLKAKGYRIKSLRCATPNKQQQSSDELQKCWEAHKQAMDWANREKEEKERLQKELDKIRREKEELQKKVSDLNSLLDNLKKENKELSEKNGKMENQLAEWQRVIETANRKISKLEEKIKNLEAQKQQYKRWYEKALNNSLEKATLKELIRELLRRIRDGRTK